MAKMKMVETSSQTDLLDNFIEVFNQTNERLLDRTNAISIRRSVKPDEGSFKKVKTAINAILDINLKKERNSRQLVETQQEIFLVPDTEEDALRISTLQSYLSCPGNHIKDLDRNILDSLFSNSSTFQTCRFAGVRTQEITELNSINKFVTSSRINSQCERYWNPRNSCLVNKGYGVFNELSNNLNNMKPHGVNGSFEQGDYSRVVRVLFDYRCRWCEETKVIIVNNKPVSNESVAEVSRNYLNDLKTINDQLDAYIQELSISATEFFSSLPDEVNTQLDELVHEELAKQLRASQVVRKTANVSLTFDLAVELDTLGDIEDIKEVISQKVKKQLGLNVNIDIGSRFLGGDYLDVKDTKFSRVEVVL